MILRLAVHTPGQGLHPITPQLQRLLAGKLAEEGLVTLYLRHTSASLLIQENYDDSVRQDLECWLNRLVPEQDPLYTHTLEGPDDMPAHIKAMLTAVSISVPVLDGALALGTWQGVYLWEHRRGPHQREVLVHVL